MNVERILALADVIEKQPHTGIFDKSGFNMGEFAHYCGTPACICGWANHQRNQSLDVKEYLGRTDHAREWLGLDRDTSAVLFRPERRGESGRDWIYDDDWWEDITPTHAAAVLRHLADTGEVDWAVSAPSVSPHE